MMRLQQQKSSMVLKWFESIYGYLKTIEDFKDSEDV